MQNIYNGVGKIGEVRPRGNLVHIYLGASFWPDRTRDGKVGLQFMDEHHSFESFKVSGSYDELSLSAPDLDYYNIYDYLGLEP